LVPAGAVVVNGAVLAAAGVKAKAGARVGAGTDGDADAGTAREAAPSNVPAVTAPAATSARHGRIIDFIPASPEPGPQDYRR
jgi:hypothetical protein